MELPRGAERQRKESPPDARWIEAKELAKMQYQPGSILLGRSGDHWIGSADDRHLMTIAGSRAGKSSTCLKPNLLLWPSSVMCIDPKGELAKDTAIHRKKMGHDVYILDPFGEVTGEAEELRVGFNPLEELRATKEDDIIDDAALLADALIVPDKGGDQHWTLAAKNLIRGLILYAIYTTTLGNNAVSLPIVRDMITAPLGDDEETPDRQRVWLSQVFKLMMGHEDAFSGVVAGVGGTMHGKPKGERGSIVSTAVEQTSFLDSGPMRTHLNGNGLTTLRQLKQRPTTIYLVLPASRMATHSRWLRMILTLALSALEREPMRLSHPVLFVLEEFPQLGYMRQIEAAAGLMAGYGVKLWTVLQDLSQIKALYRDSWETFFGNAGVIQAFGNTDATTTEYLSRRMGNTIIAEKRPGSLTASAVSSGAPVEQEANRSVPLLAPFEIPLYGGRKTGKQFILFAEDPPAYIDRLSHEDVQSLR